MSRIRKKYFSIRIYNLSWLKGAIEKVPVPERNSWFYSQCFIVPKKDFFSDASDIGSCEAFP